MKPVRAERTGSLRRTARLTCAETREQLDDDAPTRVVVSLQPLAARPARDLHRDPGASARNRENPVN